MYYVVLFLFCFLAFLDPPLHFWLLSQIVDKGGSRYSCNVCFGEDENYSCLVLSDSKSKIQTEFLRLYVDDGSEVRLSSRPEEWIFCDTNLGIRMKIEYRTRSSHILITYLSNLFDP